MKNKYTKETREQYLLDRVGPELVKKWSDKNKSGPLNFPGPDDDVVTVKLRGPIVNEMVRGWYEEDGEEAISGAEFARQISDAVENNKNVLILCDSPGGSVTEAARIRVEIIRAMQGGVPQIDCLIEGACWSAATLISAMCKGVHIEQMATMMLHSPSMHVYGNAKALREAAESLDEIQEAAIEVYAERIGEAKAIEIMDKDQDIWLSAKKSIEIGLCDEIFSAKDDDSGDVDPPPEPQEPDDDNNIEPDPAMDRNKDKQLSSVSLSCLPQLLIGG